MRTLQLREAKAGLSAVVDAAERGEATTITRHGRPAAVVMPVDVAKRLLAGARPSFASVLMNVPVEFDFDRDPSPLPDVDL